MYSELPSSIQAAKVVKKAFVAERSLVKINLSNPFVKAKSLCIFATGILRTNLQVSAIKKSIRKCPDRREHTSHQSERDETNMGSGNAWHPLTDEKYWPVEGQKEEKNYPYPLSRDIKNNDSIFLKILRCYFFKVAPFFCLCGTLFGDCAGLVPVFIPY